MSKRDFLYCEETDTKLYVNDVITLITQPNIKWVVKCGWYTADAHQKNGWYLLSIKDKTVLPIDQIDLADIVKDNNPRTVSDTPTPTESSIHLEIPDHLEIPGTDISLYSNDVITLGQYPGIHWVVKLGWYRLGTAQKNGWYLVNIADRSILPIEIVDLTAAIKLTEVGTSEFRPTIKDIDTTPAQVNFIVIPGTDIRIYDSDIIKISDRPKLKWVVHMGWYIYQGVQNFGWYITSLKDGEILPVSAIDLTLCTLVTLKTQGSEIYDGKAVNYTRPFTEADAILLNRTFITLDTIEQRDNLDKKKLINGRLVRVNDVGGVPNYYAWNTETQTWDLVDFGGGSSSGGIPDVIGTTEHPIILAELEPGLYRVKGTYKIARNYEMITLTPIDHLAFVADTGDIKVITDSMITDYVAVGGRVTFSNEYATYKYLSDNYATRSYVDNKFAILEAQISEIIEEFNYRVLQIVNARLEEGLNSITETYIDHLFE